MRMPVTPPTLAQRLHCRDHPSSSPVMFQRWADLLFLHWEISPDLIQARLPDGLYVDLHHRKTYLGLVPFSMQRVRPRFLPCVPGLSNFLELNVRAYVHDEQGRPGVWFFSLDCDQPIAVQLARSLFHLPYQHAKMSLQGGTYRCQRRGQKEPATFRWKSSPELSTAEPGSLEFFLLERYLLFSANPSGRLSCGQVHHIPYPFTSVDLEHFSRHPFQWEGFDLQGPPVSALASPGVDVSIFPLRSFQTEKER